MARLATVGADRRPRANPVWFQWDPECVLLSVKGIATKYRNLVRNPRVAISFVDPADTQRYVEVPGTVTDIELYRALEFVDLLSQKYTGCDFPASEKGQERCGSQPRAFPGLKYSEVRPCTLCSPNQVATDNNADVSHRPRVTWLT